jgi:hypothetical protein
MIKMSDAGRKICSGAGDWTKPFSPPWLAGKLTEHSLSLLAPAGSPAAFDAHPVIVSTGASVSRRNVIILSSRGLFREGIKRLLADVADVALATSLAEVQDRLRDQRVDTVIVDQQDAPAAYRDLIWQLLSWPGMRVITVSLDLTDIQIYQHQQVTQASPEALISAVAQ